MEQVVELTDGIPAIFRTSKVELARSLEEAKSSLSKLSAFLTVVLFTVGDPEFYQYHERKHPGQAEGICRNGSGRGIRKAGAGSDHMGGDLVFCIYAGTVGYGGDRG